MFGFHLDLPEFLTTYRFFLRLDIGSSDGYFLECKGFQRTQDVIEICEVTSQKWGNASKGKVVITKLPGNAKSGNITLCNGLSNCRDFWNWFQKVEAGKWAKQREYISLTIYDQDTMPQAKFELAGAWPTSYKIADCNANSSEVAIEELEIAYEDFKRVEVTLIDKAKGMVNQVFN
ncbi:phage tail protein [Nostoc sp. NMS4]|uniref:phage tail protein n=1 Tax=Nostoc sp. NMS4 TaxID=2815390 RepID=UPI0025E710E5|nr:phage tail protein [Nostoc sp. NMS4]MBN3925131.1 phage tail protein [Nostoc sp. NMS4]